MKTRLHAGRQSLIAGVALLVVVGGVLAGVLLSSGGGSAGSPPSSVQVRSALLPGVVLFGDTVTARLDVILDRSKVDPGSVRVQAAFAPWKPVAPPKQVRRDGSASSTYIGKTYVLRCLDADCTSQNDSVVEDFDAARVSYVPRGGTHRVVMKVKWPQLILDSRYAQKTLSGVGSAAAPWKAALFALPSLTYSISPSLLFALLLTGALVLLLAAGGLVYLARRQTAAARPAPTPPPPPPAPVLTPLERAFLLLELSERVDGAGDQRRALERVAEELTKHGETELAHAARALAWSEAAPGTEQTIRFAASARSRIKEVPDAPSA